ncbi:PQQ-binding-like beta-propeller repeat protein [Phycisphaerales bacterium AB-hyl4]|uniref:PQQ-binding-like beta-propeller repeat protein n=1 Tax=Natronomicrosphaera hydrolytica TaxID=3242702 RepID=A0ABV4U5Z1_9BACT
MSHVSSRWLFLLPMLFALTLTACGATERTEGEDRPEPRRSGLLVDPAEAERVGYAVNWIASVDVPSRQRIIAATLLDDLIITLERPTNMISAVSVSDGRPVWRRVADRSPDPFFRPTRRDDRIFINSASQLLMIDVRTGNIVNVVELPVAVDAPHTIVQGRAVFGGVDGRVFAIDLDTGQIRWNRQLSGRVTAAPADADDATVVGDDAGRYAMFDAQSGSMLWEGRTFGRNSATAAVDEDTVYIASRDQALYALSRSTGRDRWVYRDTVPLEWDPKLIGPTLFVPVIGDGRLVALDIEQGDVRWTYEGVAIPLATPREDRILLATPTELKVVRHGDGRELADARTRRLVTVLSGPGNSLVLVASNGDMSRLNPRR